MKSAAARLAGPFPPTPLQLLLFAATVLSVAYAGGTDWDPPARWIAAGTAPPLIPLSFAELAERLRAGTPFTVWLLAILGSHEMGHYLACRRYRIAATWPFFVPAPLMFLFGTFGAVIRIRSPIPHRRALFDVAVAGPFAGFAVAVAALVVGLLRAQALPPELFSDGSGVVFSLPWIASWLAEWLRPGEDLVMNGTLGAAWAGLLVTTLNLFAAGQLDGGHIAYACHRTLHRWLSVASLLLALGTVEAALWYDQLPAYALWVLVLAWMRDRHPPLLDESVPLGRGRAALAVVAVLVFALSFHWLPLRIVF